MATKRKSGRRVDPYHALLRQDKLVTINTLECELAFQKLGASNLLALLHLLLIVIEDRLRSRVGLSKSVKRALATLPSVFGE